MSLYSPPPAALARATFSQTYFVSSRVTFYIQPHHGAVFAIKKAFRIFLRAQIKIYRRRRAYGAWLGYI